MEVGDRGALMKPLEIASVIRVSNLAGEGRARIELRCS
jgi:hypothetical protein